jgi:transcriptional regulator with XRE-family HTH domain
MTKTINQRVGFIIREYRMKKGISQDNLAKAINVHRSYIGAIERAEKSISVRNLEKICNAMDVKMSLFFKTLESHKYLK